MSVPLSSQVAETLPGTGIAPILMFCGEERTEREAMPRLRPVFVGGLPGGFAGRPRMLADPRPATYPCRPAMTAKGRYCFQKNQRVASARPTAPTGFVGQDGALMHRGKARANLQNFRPLGMDHGRLPKVRSWHTAIPYDQQ
jgi:hypothetical protein